MTFRFGLLSVALSMLASVVARPAHAQTSVELSWDAPPECPQEAAVRARLNALAGKPTQTRRRLQAVGRIERVGKRYRLTLSVRERDSVRERTMNADSCEDLGGAAAVALGLLIRNERAASSGDNGENQTNGSASGTGQGSEARSSSEAAGARDQNEARTESSSKSPPLAPAPNKRGPSDNKNEKRDEGEDETTPAGITPGERRWRILLRAPSGALALGRVPKPSGGVAASLGASYEEWRVSVGARVLGTQTIHTDNAYDAGARIGHRDLELAVCRDWRDGRSALAPCVIAELQRETARGRGAGVTPQRASSLSVVLAAGVEARLFAFDWLALAASAALGVETSSTRLQVITAGDVKKLGPLELSFSLGPEWIF